MLLVPVNNSILYVRPFYVASDNNAQVPELREVIVVFGQQVIMRPTLNEALKVLFPGADPQTFEDLQSESLVDAGHPDRSPEAADHHAAVDR